MEQLTKKEEILLRSLYTRHGRKKSAFCVCEGLRCCREFFSLRPDLIQTAVCSEDFDTGYFPSIEFIKLHGCRLKKISSTCVSQGVIFVVRRPETAPDAFPPPNDPFIVIADRISDPGNLGTIIRTIRAVGLKELWLSPETADPFNEKVIRSAIASQFALNIRIFANFAGIFQALSRFGFKNIFRTDPHKGENCFKLENLFEKSAIIFGSEAHGAKEIANTISVTIPMPGAAESINVAQALTVILFESVRRGGMSKVL